MRWRWTTTPYIYVEDHSVQKLLSGQTYTHWQTHMRPTALPGPLMRLIVAYQNLSKGGGEAQGLSSMWQWMILNPCPRVAGVAFYLTLSVCLYVFLYNLKNRCSWDCQTWHRKCSTKNPGNSLILESKGQCHESQKRCQRTSLHSCGRWILLVYT